ncbi:MAG: VOC family protein [Spirochaetales bacterium]|nr:VOC family protein [Spirochaetales bacterium]
MDEYLICGIQQVGVGIPDLGRAFRWYRKAFGIDVPIVDDEGVAALMLPYTGGQPRARHAVMAASLQGGAALEIWQYTERAPQPAAFEIQVGDLGIYCPRIKAVDVAAAWKSLGPEKLGAGGTEAQAGSGGGAAEDCRLAPPAPDPGGELSFFVRDPHGFPFQVVPGQGWFTRGPRATGGVEGAMIGVSDVARARELYTGVLGYDQVLYDAQGVFADLAALPGGGGRLRRVLLGHSAKRRGPFSALLGPSRLELVQALDRRPRRIFAERLWGDLGFIHLCFDVRGMEALKERCAALGFPFAVDSAEAGEFEMGEGAGRFSYVEDPDGTLIEFVEAYRLAILKRWGWYLDLRRRPAGRPLPRWMLRTLSWNRVRD